MKSKKTTALFAFFLGTFGVHRFYLGQSLIGIVSLLFFWTFIPTMIGIIDFIVFITMDDEKFNRKYNIKNEPIGIKKTCALCAYELKYSNSLPFNSGKIKNGEEICNNCLKRINDIKPNVAFNLKKYDIEEIKKIVASKHARVSNAREFENRPIPNPETTTYNVPKDEEIETFEMPENIQSLNLNTLIQISYTDSIGQKSERRITIKSIYTADNVDYFINAYCHEKEAIRTFKLSRIEKIVDIETGEIFNEPSIFFIDRFNNSPLGLITKLFQENEAEILILTYVARADGYLRKKERDLISTYITLRSKTNLDPLILDDEIRRTYCERADLKKALKKVCKLTEEYKLQLFDYAKQIVETDKKTDPVEIGILELIKQELKI